MNYRERLFHDAAKFFDLKRPDGRGKLMMTTVAHDDWCLFLNGKGDCNCDPDITYREVPPNGDAP